VASVCVLLSVTDEARFLPDFLDTVLQQRGVDVRVVARGDRVPTPPEVLDAFASRDLELLELGPQLGVPEAYFRLISLTSSPADLYAFGDHDDLWDCEKLLSASEALAQVPEGTPALWICQIEPFGDPVDRQPSLGQRPPLEPSVGNALVQTIAPGCAMVWNSALHELLRKRLPSSDVLMHDSWVYLIAASIGAIVVDHRPLVRYRLHDGNTTGLPTAWHQRIRRIFWQMQRNEPSLESQAAQALQHFGDLMSPEARKLTEALATGSVWRRVRSVGPTGLRRRDKFENHALRARMFLPAQLMNSR
jgi:hypothetical protein